MRPYSGTDRSFVRAKGLSAAAAAVPLLAAAAARAGPAGPESDMRLCYKYNVFFRISERSVRFRAFRWRFSAERITSRRQRRSAPQRIPVGNARPMAVRIDRLGLGIASGPRWRRFRPCFEDARQGSGGAENRAAEGPKRFFLAEISWK